MSTNGNWRLQAALVFSAEGSWSNELSEGTLCCCPDFLGRVTSPIHFRCKQSSEYDLALSSADPAQVTGAHQAAKAGMQCPCSGAKQRSALAQCHEQLDCGLSVGMSLPLHAFSLPTRGRHQRLAGSHSRRHPAIHASQSWQSSADRPGHQVHSQHCRW